ncbi:hypothetical protein M501DRAFT_986794 [Patellaria atrata CBS 101060]|uniref:Uncharacterized protein n=1 Tax=Patellaria atrata CBS 101060 TaxID=1346257 RepID=A0A9P4VP69_9PEZI|nr:hypothetical protein M501DRAFT_986794 [Patellaria atrata CBS 101060]
MALVLKTKFKKLTERPSKSNTASEHAIPTSEIIGSTAQVDSSSFRFSRKRREISSQKTASTPSLTPIIGEQTRKVTISNPNDKNKPVVSSSSSNQPVSNGPVPNQLAPSQPVANQPIANKSIKLQSKDPPTQIDNPEPSDSKDNRQVLTLRDTIPASGYTEAELAEKERQKTLKLLRSERNALIRQGEYLWMDHVNDPQPSPTPVNRCLQEETSDLREPMVVKTSPPREPAIVRGPLQTEPAIINGPPPKVPIIIETHLPKTEGSNRPKSKSSSFLSCVTRGFPKSSAKSSSSSVTQGRSPVKESISPAIPPVPRDECYILIVGGGAGDNWGAGDGSNWANLFSRSFFGHYFDSEAAVDPSRPSARWDNVGPYSQISRRVGTVDGKSCLVTVDHYCNSLTYSTSAAQRAWREKLVAKADVVIFVYNAYVRRSIEMLEPFVEEMRAIREREVKTGFLVGCYRDDTYAPPCIWPDMGEEMAEKLGVRFREMIPTSFAVGDLMPDAVRGHRGILAIRASAISELKTLNVPGNTLVEEKIIDNNDEEKKTEKIPDTKRQIVLA